MIKIYPKPSLQLPGYPNMTPLLPSCPLSFPFFHLFLGGGGLLDCWLTLALPSSNCKVSVTRKTTFQGTPPHLPTFLHSFHPLSQHAP